MINYENLQKTSPIPLPSNRSFKLALIDIKESEEVVTGTRIKASHSNVKEGFFSFSIVDQTVRIEGYAPSKLPEYMDSKEVHIYFKLLDIGSQKETGEYSFTLLLEDSTFEQSDRVNMIFFTVVICLLILILLVCVLLASKKDKRHIQNVENQLQEHIP